MLSHMYKIFLSRKQKNKVKKIYYKINKFFTDHFFKYDEKQLKQVLVRLGIRNGDTLLVHSSFNNFNGFQGGAQDIIKCFQETVGAEGNLLMVSMPYTCSTSDYLKKNPVFNVQKTPSRMGIISEIFRRKKGVLRSLHPTHPVLASGRDAEWIVAGHEDCIFPCGKDTPFDKFRLLNGKILFFDVPFRTFTFIHYIEDLIKNSLPFSLYSSKPFVAKIIDYSANEFNMQTFAFGDIAVERRRPEVLKKNLLNRNLLIKKRIGKTKLIIVSAGDAILCTQEMMESNNFFYARGSGWEN